MGLFVLSNDAFLFSISIVADIILITKVVLFLGMCNFCTCDILDTKINKKRWIQKIISVVAFFTTTEFVGTCNFCT